MKKIVFLFVFAIPFVLFANPIILDKSYEYPYSLSSTSTKHFEFIYPSHLEEEAFYLASNAEDTIKDLVDFFGAQWPLSRPLKVVLTSDKANLNAYYSPYTFSHIVLYITPPSEGELTSYHDTILSIFEHEVAHAYTLKIHAPAMKGASVFFGDYFCNSIFLPNFMVEGMAVAFESRRDDGRLNNPFAFMSVIQALSENKIPTWRELIGAIDTYPYPQSEYIIGGAFVKFIINKYGRDKFHAFVNGFGNMFSFPYLFNRIYEVSIEDAWRTFIGTLPRSEDIVFPSSFINDKSRYKSLKFENGNFYYADLISKRVYRYSYYGVEEIATIDGTFDSFSISDNGAFLTLSVRTSDRRLTHIYETLNNKKLFTIDNSYASAFFNYNGTPLVVYGTSYGMHNSIKALSLDGREVFSFELPLQTEVISLSSFSNGRFSGIIKDEFGEYIAIFDITTGENRRYMHHGLLYEGLSSKSVKTSEDDEDESVILTVAIADSESVFELKNYPNVLEMLFTTNGDFISAKRYTTNIDGGVHYPLIVEDNIYFISKLFENDKLSTVPLSASEFIDYSLYENGSFKPYTVGSESVSTIKGIEEYSVGQILDKKHFSRFLNSIPFVNKGALIPMFYNHKNSTISAPLALSYFSGDPTESVMSTLSFAYDMRPFVKDRATKYFEVNKLLFELSWNINILPVHFTIGARPYLFLDKATGLTVFGDFYLLSEYKHTFDYTTNYLKASLLFGWNGRFKGTLDIGENGFYVDADVSYTDCSKVGYGYDEYEGYRVGATYSLTETTYTNPLFMGASLYGILFVPRIIPIKNLPHVTFNFPFRLNLVLNYSYNGVLIGANDIGVQYDHILGAYLDVDIVMASFVIDKLISDYFPFVVNNFTLKFTPSLTYKWLTSSATSFHVMDIGLSAEAFFTLSAAFLGMGIAEGDTDIGVKYEMAWRSSTLNTSFTPYALYNYGKFSLIARFNVGV